MKKSTFYLYFSWSILLSNYNARNKFVEGAHSTRNVVRVSTGPKWLTTTAQQHFFKPSVVYHSLDKSVQYCLSNVGTKYTPNIHHNTKQKQLKNRYNVNTAKTQKKDREKANVMFIPSLGPNFLMSGLKQY